MRKNLSYLGAALLALSGACAHTSSDAPEVGEVRTYTQGELLQILDVPRDGFQRDDSYVACAAEMQAPIAHVVANARALVSFVGFHKAILPSHTLVVGGQKTPADESNTGYVACARAFLTPPSETDCPPGCEEIESDGENTTFCVCE